MNAPLGWALAILNSIMMAFVGLISLFLLIRVFAMSLRFTLSSGEAFSETISELLVAWAARRLPEEHRELYEEEWLAELASLSNGTRRLSVSMGILLTRSRLASVIGERRRRWILRLHVSGSGALLRLMPSLLSLAALLVPPARRSNYRREWKAELWKLRPHLPEMLRFVLRTLGTAWDTGRAWVGLPSWSTCLHRLRRLEHVVIGLLASLVTFATFMSILPSGMAPTRQQLFWAALAAVSAGVLAGIKWHREHPFRPREDDLEAYEDDDD